MKAYEVEPAERERGWCVEVTHTAPSGRVIPSYWYGPDYAFGTTSGPLEDVIDQRRRPGGCWAWYPTRAAALAAKRGSAIAGRRHYRVRRVADAMHPSE